MRGNAAIWWVVAAILALTAFSVVELARGDRHAVILLGLLVTVGVTGGYVLWARRGG